MQSRIFCGSCVVPSGAKDLTIAADSARPACPQCYSVAGAAVAPYQSADMLGKFAKYF
jgi:hypothetical protein